MTKYAVSFQPIIFIGCIRRTNEKITEDYDEIDRRDPPVFINNTRTKVVVAAGKTASLECRVMNIGDRTVGSFSRDNFCVAKMIERI